MATNAMGKADVRDGEMTVAAGDYGPVDLMMNRELAIHRCDSPR